MNVTREYYLNKLKSHIHDGFVKIITGIRRCGKSHLLFKQFKEYLIGTGVDECNILEIQLDADDFRPYRNAIALGEYLKSRLPTHRKSWFYVFIDEIQMCRKVLPEGVDLSRYAPEDRDELYVTFYDVLNGLRQRENVDVYVTGSNSKLLSTDIATNFRDRGVQIRIHPFSFGEYWPVSGCAERAQAFDRYLVWGGMPEAVALQDEGERAEYLKRLFTEVYLKDICERHRLKGDYVLGNVIDCLSSAVGSLTNPSRLANAMKTILRIETTDDTVNNYLGYLENAFLFSRVRRFEVKGGRYIESPSKYYAEDVGLRNARLNFRQVEPTHLMENVVYNELVRRGANVDVGVVPVVTRVNGKQEMRQHEIDFIVNTGMQKVYIQSAFSISDGEKFAQETLPLRKSGDFFRKVVVTSGYAEPRAGKDGIVTVGILPFLLDEKVYRSVVS